MKKSTAILLFIFAYLFSTIYGAEYHVAKNGNNNNSGTQSHPFKTISKAVEIAQPGDEIIVHKGTYRERVDPQKGGVSAEKRIVYRAAENENVIIKGSEIITGWQKFKGNVWKVEIPNTFFGEYNPYNDIIYGDWFKDLGRAHHTGAVYLNGQSFYESNTLQNVLSPQQYPKSRFPKKSMYTWYCETDQDNTYIYANFHGKNPNKETIEINVRKACFYPSHPGINYITVSGFEMCHAATQWAPPTAEQIGLLGTHWSKGWVIQDNIIHDSRCVGITLGKDRTTGHNVWINNNKCKSGATTYNEVVFKALQSGWSKELVGSHLVRGNTIYNCEQAGIVGSLGAIFSTIQNNHIYDIWTKRLFEGAEMAGIKIHAAIDVLIANNHVHNTGRGIWIDWMAQGTRITANLLYDNTTDDLFSEVNHGPYLVDNNICLSKKSLRDYSQGGAFVHNLFAGYFEFNPVDDRATPYHYPHSTQITGLDIISGGDNRFYNNLFMIREKADSFENKKYGFEGYGLSVYKQAKYPLYTGGNVFLIGTRPWFMESNCLVDSTGNNEIIFQSLNKKITLSLNITTELHELQTRLITTSILRQSITTGLRYELPDGTDVIIDTDFFGNKRNTSNPTSGPFSELGIGENSFAIANHPK